MKQTIIYLRTSSEEQNPQNQRRDCEELTKQLHLTNYEVLEEQKSAFKDVKREVFSSIKKAIQQGKVKNLIVWDFDRLYRNRIKTIEFIRNYSKVGLKVYSYRQKWFQDLEKIPEPFNEIVYDLMLQIISWLGEEESKKKSERVKSAVRRTNGITKSYKGKKWGRKTIKSHRLKEEVRRLKEQGLTLRQIAKQVFYYDKNNNKRNPSPASVYKLLKEK